MDVDEGPGGGIPPVPFQFGPLVKAIGLYEPLRKAVSAEALGKFGPDCCAKLLTFLFPFRIEEDKFSQLDMAELDSILTSLKKSLEKSFKRDIDHYDDFLHLWAKAKSSAVIDSTNRMSQLLKDIDGRRKRTVSGNYAAAVTAAAPVAPDRAAQRVAWSETKSSESFAGLALLPSLEAKPTKIKSTKRVISLPGGLDLSDKQIDSYFVALANFTDVTIERTVPALAPKSYIPRFTLDGDEEIKNADWLTIDECFTVFKEMETMTYDELKDRPALAFVYLEMLSRVQHHAFKTDLARAKRLFHISDQTDKFKAALGRVARTHVNFADMFLKALVTLIDEFAKKLANESLIDSVAPMLKHYQFSSAAMLNRTWCSQSTLELNSAGKKAKQEAARRGRTFDTKNKTYWTEKSTISTPVITTFQVVMKPHEVVLARQNNKLLTERIQNVRLALEADATVRENDAIRERDRLYGVAKSINSDIAARKTEVFKMLVSAHKGGRQQGLEGALDRATISKTFSPQQWEEMKEKFFAGNREDLQIIVDRAWRSYNT